MEIYYYLWGKVYSSTYSEQEVAYMVEVIEASEMIYFFSDPADVGF